MQWLGTETQGDGPWERTLSSCAETAQRAWGVIWAKPELIVSVHGRAWLQQWTLLVCTVGERQHQRITREEYSDVPFPAEGLQFCPPHTAAWRRIWGRQVLGEPYHRGSPSPRWQRNHLDSCSHNTPAPSTSLALGTKGMGLHGAKRRPHPNPVQALVTTTPITCPIKGITL